MKRNVRDDTYTLSTGMCIAANNGIIGLCPDGGVFEGYDGCIEDHDAAGDPDFASLTHAERVEIADYMIARWQAYRAKHVR